VRKPNAAHDILVNRRSPAFRRRLFVWVLQRCHVTVRRWICSRPFLTHRTKVPYTAFGTAGNRAFDYVTRRFNVSSAGLKNPWGCTFAETPLSAISRSNWGPESV